MDYISKPYADRTLQRLLPRLEQGYKHFKEENPQIWDVFCQRLEIHFPRLFHLLFQLYGGQYDFFYHVQALLEHMLNSWFERPAELKRLDLERERQPDWFLSHQQLGGVCYVDLFAGNLQGIRDRIPYFKELGLTYLHLMPLYACPEAESDGGYAVSSFREVNPQLGTMEELRQLATDLRKAGISLALDLVFNHTSDEHAWVKAALEGDTEYAEYYFMFPDRTMPDRYERHLREIFPDEHPGAFTYLEQHKKWVWTTFHSYQWDLNYRNPAVFNAMAGELLFLANAGAQIVRFDAVPFIWKEMGTSCENLPQAHALIQAFNAVCRIAAPSLLFKSEAIVHPDDVASYISLEECQVSYNPLFMALLWNSLATRQVNLLKQALYKRHALPAGCAWVNYVRCHDDIGWTFADEDAAQAGIEGFPHRQFLNAFYTGRFPGSFARGLPFQENPKTGDARISGTCASLAGLEKALNEETQHEVELALRRITLLHALIMTIGGIPLIYLGDEIATLNDYSYRNDPGKCNDSRWVHRPRASEKRYAARNESGTIEHNLYQRLRQWITIRKSHSALSAGFLQVMNTENEHVLGFVRRNDEEQLVILANFSEEPQRIPANVLRLYGQGYQFVDLIQDQSLELHDLALNPLEVCLIKAV
jgi:amylosucrase